MKKRTADVHVVFCASKLLRLIRLITNKPFHFVNAISNIYLDGSIADQITILLFECVHKCWMLKSLYTVLFSSRIKSHIYRFWVKILPILL